MFKQHQIISAWLARTVVFMFCLGVFSYGQALPKMTPHQQREYRRSGAYFYDIEHVTDSAKSYLKAYLEKNKRRKYKPAIVLDVDETSITSYKDVGPGRLPGGAVPGVLELYKYALKKGVRVFFVTNRRRTASGLRRLKRKLRRAGYRKWRGIYMKTPRYWGKSPASFKVRAGKKIEKRGYTIILTVGDQRCDLYGPYTGKRYKLPNPFYDDC